MTETSQFTEADVMPAVTGQRDAVDRPDKRVSLADVIESLFLTFERRLGLATVLAVVQACCHEADIDAEPGALSRIQDLSEARLRVLAAACTMPESARPDQARPGPRPALSGARPARSRSTRTTCRAEPARSMTSGHTVVAVKKQRSEA